MNEWCCYFETGVSEEGGVESEEVFEEEIIIQKLDMAFSSC